MTTPFAGILLCGGASRRFGSDKARAAVDGEAMAARAWRLLGAVCAERLAVGRSYPDLGIEALADSDPGAGPLAALADGLARISTAWAFVLPCDLPRLPAAAVGALAARAAAGPAVQWTAGRARATRMSRNAPRPEEADRMSADEGPADLGVVVVEAVVVETGGRARPLPGLYAVSVLPVARRLLAEGRRAVRDLLDAVPHAAVAPAAWGDPAGATLVDLDRPPAGR